MSHSADTSDPPKSIPILDEIVNPLSNAIFAMRGPYSVKYVQRSDSV